MPSFKTLKKTGVLVNAGTRTSLGSVTLEVGGRKAVVTYVQNAHTDGDSIVQFADANVIAASSAARANPS